MEVARGFGHQTVQDDARGRSERSRPLHRTANARRPAVSPTTPAAPSTSPVKPPRRRTPSQTTDNASDDLGGQRGQAPPPRPGGRQGTCHPHAVDRDDEPLSRARTGEERGSRAVTLVGVRHRARHDRHDRAGPAPDPHHEDGMRGHDPECRHPQGEHHDERDGAEDPDPGIRHDLEAARPFDRDHQTVRGVGQTIEVQTPRHGRVHSHRDHRRHRSRPHPTSRPPPIPDQRAHQRTPRWETKTGSARRAARPGPTP